MKHLKIASILIIILGFVHLLATPVIFFPLFKFMDIELVLSFLYMFIITGVATLFVGMLQFHFINNYAGNPAFKKAFKGSIVFIFILGLGAVATMWTNPFAYLALLIAVYQIIVYKKNVASDS